jgi:AcrR family transcriptional regulator
MTQGRTARRGRPRDDAADQRILDAAWDLLHSAGYAGLSVDEVAERAGVAKTTLYRRWPTKDHLAIAVAARMLGEVPIPDTGDLQADLTEFASALAVQLNRVRAAGMPDPAGRSAGLVAELAAAAARHSDIGEVVRAGFAVRHAQAQARLQRARERGGLRPGIDPELLIEQLVGPIYYRILITGAPVDRSYAARLTAAVLDGALPPVNRRRQR